MSEDKFVNDLECVNIIVPQCNSCIHQPEVLKCDKGVEITSDILFNIMKCDSYKERK